MNSKLKQAALFTLFSLNALALVASYPEGFYGGFNSYGDETYVPERLSDYQMVAKRSFPRWHHQFVYREPTYNRRTSAIAETKRFLPPFHPLARFRGLSMHGGGGGRTNYYRPREDYETLVSYLPSQPSPAHPVPSDTKFRVQEDDDSDMSAEDTSSDFNRMNAGDILKFLTTVPERQPGGRGRVFRFGIK